MNPENETEQAIYERLVAENKALKAKNAELQLVSNLLKEYGLQALAVVEAFKKQSEAKN